MYPAGHSFTQSQNKAPLMSWLGGHNEIICYNALLTTNAYFRLVASTSRFILTQMGREHLQQDAQTHTSCTHKGTFSLATGEQFFRSLITFLPPFFCLPATRCAALIFTWVAFSFSQLLFYVSFIFLRPGALTLLCPFFLPLPTHSFPPFGLFC